MNPTRREFLAAATVFTVHGQSGQTILVEDGDPLASRELRRGLGRLRLPAAVRPAAANAQPGVSDLLLALRLDPARFRNPEAYSISTGGRRVTFAAPNRQALLYAVFDFLERQGAFFGIDGESYPLEPAARLVLPPAGAPWTASPRFAVRGLLPWPDFLNCITVYNEEDFRAYFESMLRMRFNTFGMHVYTQAEQWAESYLSFEFGGVGHLAHLDTTAGNRWGYLPQRTSRYTMGGAQYYDSEVFGSDATRLARDPWEGADRARKLLQHAFAHAARLGIRTGIGFEPYQIPDEIFRALPPEARTRKITERGVGPRFNVESVTARKLLETRLGQLLEAYPGVDYVWLWEDESMNWESRKTGIPLSPTPFLQAHDFLRRNAPKKRLVVSGWGGMARHFEDFHRKLPLDIVFSCLSDSLGWDPVHDAFGKLEGRERWPIPWLEDDPGMWQAQFRVHRFQSDIDRALGFGCQGMLGIHWRHRIVDPTAGYLARYSWDPKLTPAQYYRAYAGTQAAAARAPQLAEILTGVDREGKLLSTFSGEIKGGHAVTQGFSGDYSEAFEFWRDFTPSEQVVRSQKEVAGALRALLDAARSPNERERLGYLLGHVEFLIPYAEAWTLAHKLHRVLETKDRAKVAAEGVPLWLKLAPEVRKAMLCFQNIVANRPDLGTLASKHNKFVRLALIRLRLSIEEHLGELPPETEKLLAEVTRPDPAAPARLFAPTRPTVLFKGESVRVLLVVTGSEPIARVTLHTRQAGSPEWSARPARPLGRRTYEARLGPCEEYRFTAEVGGRKLMAPPEGTYALTLA